MVGGIGNDDLGNIALRSLIKAGVNIDHVITRSDWRTGCAAIRSMGNSKSILTGGGIADPTVVFDYLQTLKQFPAYLNRWDSQQARNEGVFAH